MSSWSDVARAGETIECPPAGQQIRFLKTAAETGGELLRIAVTLAADSSRVNAVKHIHPHQTETLTVRTGQMGINDDGQVSVLGPGDTVTFTAGDAHAFWNAGDDAVELEIEVRPALQLELFMRFSLGLSQVGRTTRSGIPLNPFRLGLLLAEFDDHLYIAGLPIWLQKWGAAVLAPIARLLEYSLDLEDDNNCVVTD